MKLAVVDYGMGNLRSVSKAIEHVAAEDGTGVTVCVTSDPDEVAAADRVVFPGQGAMPDCMREMDSRGLRQAVLVAARSKPFLGICIGLQMLFESSDEGGVAGLSVLPGRVRRFPEDMAEADGRALKVPHMGWNQVRQAAAGHVLWSGIEDQSRFYFVHSYYADPTSSDLVSGTAVYGRPFTCAVAQDNIFAVQFHPEKSQVAGLRLLANYIHWNP